MAKYNAPTTQLFLHKESSDAFFWASLEKIENKKVLFQSQATGKKAENLNSSAKYW